MAYELAEFYARNARMRDADHVLEWVSDNIAKTWGINHKRSITHMLHITDLYCVWSRQNDALTLLLRATEYQDELPVIDSLKHQEEENDSQLVQPANTTHVTRSVNTSEFNSLNDRPRTTEVQLLIVDGKSVV